MQSVSKHRDPANIAALTAGSDRQTFAGLAAQYRPALVRFFLRRSSTFANEAEDLVQEVFVRLMQRYEDGQILNVEAYLFQTASSVLIDRSRRASTRRACEHQSYEDDAHASHLYSPDRLLEGRQAIEIVRDTLRLLPERARNAFLLHRFEDLSYAEIATRLGVSVSSIEKDIMRALKDISGRLGANAPQKNGIARKG